MGKGHVTTTSTSSTVGITTTSTGDLTSSQGKSIDVTLKLSQLQNLCKRDPFGYKSDYEAQIRRLYAECNILLLNPTVSIGAGIDGGSSSGGGSSDAIKNLVELIQFASAVSSSSYGIDESNKIATILIHVLLGKQLPSLDEITAKTTARETAATTNVTINNNNKKLSRKQRNKQKHKQEQQHQQDGSTSSSPLFHLDDTAATTNIQLLNRDVRKACISGLILMRNKGAIEPIRILELFFKVMSVISDKALREMLYRHIVNDIRNINKKGKRDNKVNRSIQTFLHRIVASTTSKQSTGNNNPAAMDGEEESVTDVAAKRAVDMVCELYRKRVWTDEKCVAIVASGVESANVTIMCRSMRFFLNIEEKMAYDQQSTEDEIFENATSNVNLHSHSKKTKARLRNVMKQITKRKKAQTKKENGTLIEDELDNKNNSKLYPAIEMLRNPQGLVELVFKRLRSNNKETHKYEIKLLMINFITRLIGNHELLLLPLYSFLQRYMSGGHQRDVTLILAYTIQACHQYVQPDEIYGILKTISHNFITERCSGEEMAVGINTIRAICTRVPSVLLTQDDQIQQQAVRKAPAEEDSSATTSGSAGVGMDIEAFTNDLVSYSNHRDRSVSIAAKAWTNFIREAHPSLLSSKHRGKVGSALYRNGKIQSKRNSAIKRDGEQNNKASSKSNDHKPLQYGENNVSMGVAGADLLIEYESKKKAYKLKRQQEKQKIEASRARTDNNDEDDDDDASHEERMNDEEEEEEDDNSGDVLIFDEEKDGEEASHDDDDDDDDEEAPQLVLVEDDSSSKVSNKGKDGNDMVVDTSKMSTKERQELQQKISSTRVFTADDFRKMRKLVEREERAKRDPRYAARRKRLIAQGKDFEALSDDDVSDDDSFSDNDNDDYVDDGNMNMDDDDDDQNQVHISGAVNPSDIMAMSKKKRMNKAERLQKVIDGRSKFESKVRDGGSTNIEKKRKKNFVMTKYSAENRIKRNGTKGKKWAEKKNGRMSNNNHDAKKRRRKF